MNQYVKAKWVAALRSGEFEQSTGELKMQDGSGHCCLGVLCEVHLKEHPEHPGFRYEGDLSTYGENKTSGILPHEVRQWAGLEDDGVVQFHAKKMDLWVLNDRKWLKQGFAEIADLIEQQL